MSSPSTTSAGRASSGPREGKGAIKWTRYSRSNPCRARRLSADGDHGRYRSIGRKDRQEPKGSFPGQAIASRSGPSGSVRPRNPKSLCRRRSSASRDHAAGAWRRLRPRIPRDGQILTAEKARQAHDARSGPCARRPHLHQPLGARRQSFLQTYLVRPKSFWTKRESAPDGDDPKTEDRIPAYDGEKALQEIAATRLLLVSAIASAVTPIVRIVAAISFRVGRFASLIRTPRIAAW